MDSLTVHGGDLAQYSLEALVPCSLGVVWRQGEVREAIPGVLAEASGEQPLNDVY